MEIYYFGGLFTENIKKCKEAARFIFVPYVPPGRINEALETIEAPYENVRAYFSHQEFYGAKMGAIVSQCGDKWSSEKSLNISGHLHDRDQLQENIIYVGTPYQHTYNEPDKTVSLFIFNEDKTWKEERFDLGLKKKITIYLSPDKVSNYEPPEDKLVKLVIKGDEASLKTISKLNKINELKKKGVKIVFKVVQDKEVNNNKYVHKMNYKDRLLLEIKEDTDSIKWFHQIFQ
jgi:hypothetical protein